MLDSSIQAPTGSRLTTIVVNTGWYSPGNSTGILLTLTQQSGFGAFVAAQSWWLEDYALFRPARLAVIGAGQALLEQQPG